MERGHAGAALREALGWLARTLLEAALLGLGILALLWTVILSVRLAREPWGPFAYVPAALVPAALLAGLAWRCPPWRAPGAAWLAARLWLFIALGVTGILLLASSGRAWGPAMLLALAVPGVPGAVGIARRLRGLDARPGRRPAGPRPELPALGWPEIQVEDEALHVVRYPYAHASVAPGGVRLAPERITAVFHSSTPAVVLDGREVLFLPESQREPLARFAERYALPRPSIPDVWARVAEPSIDQPYTPEDEARDDATLAGLGFPREEVRALRSEVGPMMATATFYTMEWGGYSAEDVLRAYALLRPRALTAERYAWLMRIALRPYAAASRLEAGRPGG